MFIRHLQPAVISSECACWGFAVQAHVLAAACQHWPTLLPCRWLSFIEWEGDTHAGGDCLHCPASTLQTAALPLGKWESAGKHLSSRQGPVRQNEATNLTIDACSQVDYLCGVHCSFIAGGLQMAALLDEKEARVRDQAREVRIAKKEVERLGPFELSTKQLLREQKQDRAELEK